MNQPLPPRDRRRVASFTLHPSEIAALRRAAKRTKTNASRLVGELIRTHLTQDQ